MTRDFIILGVIIGIGAYFLSRSFKPRTSGNYLHCKKMNNVEAQINRLNNAETEYVEQNKQIIIKDCSQVDKEILRLEAEQLEKGIGKEYNAKKRGVV